MCASVWQPTANIQHFIHMACSLFRILSAYLVVLAKLNVYKLCQAYTNDSQKNKEEINMYTITPMMFIADADIAHFLYINSCMDK